MGFRVPGIAGDRLPMGPDGLVHPLQPQQRNAEIRPHRAQLRIDPERRLIARHRLIEPVGRLEHHPAIGVINGVAGLARHRLVHRRYGLVGLARLMQDQPEQMVGLGMAGIGGEHPRAGIGGLLQLPGGMQLPRPRHSMLEQERRNGGRGPRQFGRRFQTHGPGSHAPRASGAHASI